MREIGVLLIAFAPLDDAFSSGPRARTLSLFFVAFGLFFFSWALFLEGKRARGP